MGWETLAVGAFSLLGANNSVKQGKAQANAIATQGTQDALATADNTVRNAGRLTTSFLQSGLTLDGGPMDVISRAFAQGKTDIGRIESNANAGAKNVVSAARTKALNSLATTALAGTSSSIFGEASNFATDVGNGFDSFSSGTGFGLGYDASQSFRKFGGGFGPGEFVNG